MVLKARAISQEREIRLDVKGSLSVDAITAEIINVATVM